MEAACPPAAHVPAAGRARPLQQQMANLECNAVCAVAITHHFLTRMVRPCSLAQCRPCRALKRGESWA